MDRVQADGAGTVPILETFPKILNLKAIKYYPGFHDLWRIAV
jgi:hypothetical protein